MDAPLDLVPQVVGRAEPHNLALIHPNQDRVLTIRENARTQVGFLLSCCVAIHAFTTAQVCVHV